MLQRDKESQTQDSPPVRQNLHRQIKRQRTIRISSGRGESRMTRVRKIMKREIKSDQEHSRTNLKTQNTLPSLLARIENTTRSSMVLASGVRVHSLL
jgi:hypothetical protein